GDVGKCRARLTLPIGPIFLPEHDPKGSSLVSPNLRDSERTVDAHPVKGTARDLDLNRKVGRRVDFQIDVVGIPNSLQVAEVKTLIRLETLIHVLTAEGRRTHGHHRN